MSRPVSIELGDVGPIDRNIRFGWRIAGGFLVTMLAFITLASISSAVIAPAIVRVDLYRRPVQHMEGGTIGKVFVRDGQHVRQGELLAEFRSVAVEAGLELIDGQLKLERVRLARLDAERQGEQNIRYAPDLVKASAGDAALAEAMGREARLFESRLRTFNGQIQAVNRQMRAARSQTDALDKQTSALGRAHAAATQELEMNQGLQQQQFVPRARLLALESSSQDLLARQEEARALQAQSVGRTEELQRELAAVTAEYRDRAAMEHREAAAKVAELEQRLRPNVDAAERQKVHAPVAGRIVGLAVTAPGAVVEPRGRLMEIVPDDEKLVFEGQVDPADIARIQLDADAEVRMSVSRYRRSSGVMGKVIGISADAFTDERSGRSYFKVQVEVPASAFHRPGMVPPQAGMSADVYIHSHARSIAWYLVEPIVDYMRGAMREE